MPDWLKEFLRVARDFIYLLLYTGKNKYCPVCGKYSRKFRTYGETGREGSVCVHCNSLERHRLIWLFLKRKTNLFDGKKKLFLHFAPERCFLPRLERLLGAENYLTADLYDKHVKFNMDITNIQFEEGSIDAVYCSHVLEHVQDDRKALSEIHRILKNDGWAIFMVPVNDMEETFEDPAVTDPAERLRLFGQEDHVRCYGKDFIFRLKDAGFRVSEVSAESLCPEEEILKMGLLKDEFIYYCTKS